MAILRDRLMVGHENLDLGIGVRIPIPQPLALMKNILHEFNLNPNNSVVIGSGILQALGIRKSNDIDLVVDDKTFDSLKKSGKFKIKTGFGEREILYNDLFEIGKELLVLDKNMKLIDLSEESVVMDEVRYLGLNLLYKIKKSWITAGTAREKDIEDVKLIEKYKNNLKIQ